MSTSSPTDGGPPGPLLPLAIAHTGERVVCMDVRGGPGLRRHMADLGILPGAAMTVVCGGGCPGPVVVRLQESAKLMIGRGMAHKILVRPA